ncbi:MAG: hypothetical protein M1840_007388 [Geoglossum simile]|nr:MAG: hypothetical protein M1840_007388 [Geoglossum simile]
MPLARAAATPISSANGTGLVETTGWRSEPATRGTFRLLSSCLITLSLCVYTALHLNMFPKGHGRTTIFWKKFQWALMGMFAPELVLFTSWIQRQSAKQLVIEVNKCFERQKIEQGDRVTRRHQWTIVHGFYAGMGGFVFDTNDADSPAYIPNSPLVPLTAQGVLVIAELGYLPDISEEFILDKSKADDIAKSLAIIQATWLLVQCITRVASHLPLTMLEINTLAHVICALGMYWLWWKKPLDVRNPTVLSGNWVRPLCAMMWMQSPILKSWSDYLKILSYPVPEISLPDPHGYVRGQSGNFRVIDTQPIPLGDRQTILESSADPINPGQPLVDETTSTRWGLCVQGSREFAQFASSPRFRQADALVNLRIFNWPARRVGCLWPNTKLPDFLLPLATLLYGALHVAAWNEYYPSDVERTLWRVSALYLACAGTAYMISVKWYLDGLVGDLLPVLLFLAFIVYVAARVFLVIECFISLRELPVEAYQTPIWTQYLPHL